MRIKQRKREDGTTDIIVQRTRQGENPTVQERGVPPEKLEETLAKLIAEVQAPAPTPVP